MSDWLPSFFVSPRLAWMGMIAHFALLLICGLSLMWCLMPRAQVTSGFFRIQMLITLGLGVLGVLSGQASGWSTPRLGLAAAIAGVSFFGSVVWTLERRRAGTVCVFLVAALAVFGVVWAAAGHRGLTWPGSPAVSVVFSAISELASAGVIGGAVVGMLLGHWYLTAPTMSIAPLGTVTRCFGGALVLRLMLSAAGVVMGSEMLAGQTQWTWFALRWLAGILGPLVICFMALRILRYRNTQAATGVLFAGVILTLIGELSAFLLSREVHLPL